MKKIFNTLSLRLREPSTHAGLASLLALAHLNIDPGVLQYGVDGLAAIFGILGILLSEKK